MDYDKIIIDLLNRIVVLEEKIERLESAGMVSQSNSEELPAVSKKYRYLADYLHESGLPRIKLTYSEIESILQFKLPDSAVTHRAFWANTTTHSIALSWLGVNYEVVEVSLENKFIVFERKRNRGGRSTAMTEEKHLCNCKNEEMINLYLQLRTVLFGELSNVTTAATADYISWSIGGGRQFANFYIQKKKIRVLTLEPLREYSLGETVPDTHLWTLNYQTDVFSVNDLEVAKAIILESYNQLDR